MEVIGLIAAAIIGLSLGLIGAGGAILILPVLVYLFRIPPAVATAYSLFIAGVPALVGAINSRRCRRIDFVTTLLLGLPTVIAVFITRNYIMPEMPTRLFTVDNYIVTKDTAIMVLLAVLMLSVSFVMIHDGNNVRLEYRRPVSRKRIKLFFYGIVIGIGTGILGAGAGFLLIPVLVTIGRLPMKRAVDTSLWVMALSTLIGFAGDVKYFHGNWMLLLTISLLAIVGVVMGEHLSARLPERKLKHAFGWFVLAIAIYILIGETVLQ